MIKRLYVISVFALAFLSTRFPGNYDYYAKVSVKYDDGIEKEIYYRLLSDRKEERVGRIINVTRYFVKENKNSPNYYFYLENGRVIETILPEKEDFKNLDNKMFKQLKKCERIWGTKRFSCAQRIIDQIHNKS
ncbi:hypothetical protein GW950_01105 [Candidatus Wolfebacteria bacterium]|nr:hypothetical protein [Candidatus Wolfebacteria bacterium]